MSSGALGSHNLLLLLYSIISLALHSPITLRITITLLSFIFHFHLSTLNQPLNQPLNQQSTTNRYKNLNQIDSKHRLLLSGTPVQNDVSELLALLSFLMPRVFKRSNCQIILDALGLDDSVVKTKKGKEREKALLAAGQLDEKEGVSLSLSLILV